GPRRLAVADRIGARGVLAEPIYVRPIAGASVRTWTYTGYGRFEGLLHGRVGGDSIVTFHRCTIPPRGHAPSPDATTVRDGSRPPIRTKNTAAPSAAPPPARTSAPFRPLAPDTFPVLPQSPPALRF